MNISEALQNLDLLSLLQQLGPDTNSTPECDPSGEGTNPNIQLDRELSAIIVTWISSVVVTILLTIAQRRTRCKPDALCGRPGLPIPMDFLVTPRQRLIYVILFAVMGTSLQTNYGNFGSLFSLEGDEIYTKVLNKTLWSPFFTVVTLILQYFPLFACVEFSYPIVGFSLGLLYSLIWYFSLWVPRFLFYDGFVKSCSITNPNDRALISVVVLRDAPLIILGAFVVLWYSFQFVLHCIVKPICKLTNNASRFQIMMEVNEFYHSLRQYHIDRVRCLLKKPPEKKEPTNKVMKIVFRILKYFFPFKKNYKLPLPLVGAVVAMVMIIYQLSCSMISVTLIFLSRFIAPLFTQGIDPLSDVLESAANGSETILTTASLLRDIGGSLLIGVPTVIVISPFASLSICIFLLIHMVASISVQTKEAAKNGFQGRLPVRHRRLSGFWAYTGLQIGLFFSAWVLYTVIVILVGLALIVIVLLLKYSQTRTYVFTLLIVGLIPLAWARLLFFGQTLICQYVFLEDKNKEDATEAKFIPITNKRLFQWFSLVLFFYNGFAGIVAGIVRIAISALFGLILIFRLDLLSLPKELWWWDFSHKSFLSFIYLDYCYNNPVLQVFTQLLVTSVSKEKGEANVELVGADDLERANTAKINRIRNRWRVAYTLIRNPSIQKYTAMNIELLKSDEKLAQVFHLEHTIKRHSEVGVEDEVGGAEKLTYEEDLGVEVKPQGHGDQEDETAVEIKVDLGKKQDSNDYLTSYERMA